MNGKSKWNVIGKRKAFIRERNVVKASPKLCKCGYRRKIGGDGGKEASFFYDSQHGEWVCAGCGAILGK